MIISHQHRFIFIKTRKTAGTSVELWLSDKCGPDDVLTPLSRKEERQRRPHGPRNYRIDAGRGQLAGLVARMTGTTRFDRFINHSPASQVRKVVGPEIWDSYLTFTIERNPWDRQVSYYYFLKRQLGELSFEAFMDHPRARMNNFEIYADGDEIIVDRILTFENLASDMTTLSADLGLPPPHDLPHAKAYQRPREPGYRQHYSDQTREQVARWYRREIEALDYTF